MSGASPGNRGVGALLSDLGGVMIDIDFERMFDAWAPPSAQLRRRFCGDSAYRRHERGERSSSAYFAHVRRLLEPTAGDKRIAAGWNAIFVGAAGEVPRLVHKARTARPAPASPTPIRYTAASGRATTRT